jgi:ATP-dependent RNA helicase DDX42
MEQQLKSQDSKKHETQLPEIVSGGFDNNNDDEYECSDQIMDMENEEYEYDYDSDGNPLTKTSDKTKTRIDPLPPVDHSTINYPKFKKNLYREHQLIHSLSENEIASIRNKLDLSVIGDQIPRPILEFSQAGFYKNLLDEIHKRGFETPTPIQSQTIPIALSGRDILGLAKTGSGKTFAFVW